MTKGSTNKLILLGTKGGPAIRPNGSMPTSSLLLLDNQKIVVDAGLGVTQKLVNNQFDLRTLSTIFITHLHSDHILELGPLIHTAWTTGLKSCVNVYGPKGLSDYWDNFLRSLELDIKNRISNEGRIPLKSLARFHTVPLRACKIGSVKAYSIEVPHPPLVECFAYKFVGTKTLTFSGDTHYFPPLAKFAKNSHILVHEAMLTGYVDTLVKKTGLGDKLRNHLLSSHTPLEKAVEIAKMANCKTLVLNHLIPNDDPDYDREIWLREASQYWNGPIIVGNDGLEIGL